jgi:hypothetical protein
MCVKCEKQRNDNMYTIAVITMFADEYPVSHLQHQHLSGYSLQSPAISNAVRRVN